MALDEILLIVMKIIIIFDYYKESGDFIPKKLDHNSPYRGRRRS